MASYNQYLRTHSTIVHAFSNLSKNSSSLINRRHTSYNFCSVRKLNITWKFIATLQPMSANKWSVNCIYDIITICVLFRITDKNESSLEQIVILQIYLGDIKKICYYKVNIQTKTIKTSKTAPKHITVLYQFSISRNNVCCAFL